MSAPQEFRALLEAGDVDGLRAAWASVAPNLPQPETREAAEATMHYARTSTPIRFFARAYSHRWLSERGLPSGLPDELKPKAERVYPRIAAAVGISANTNSPILQPAMPIVRKAMGDAVEELVADGVKLDDRKAETQKLIRGRIREAREGTLTKLFGHVFSVTGQKIF